MRRAQIYKRLIAACNPIALLAQVWHQKSIWGCLAADKSATAERRCGAWTINILGILLCLKCLLCRWMDMPLSFQPTDSVQATDTTLCVFRTAYLCGNSVNRHKIHKNHTDLHLYEFSAFSAQSNLESAENVESSCYEDCRNLSFWLFAPFVSQKAKKVQKTYYE